MEENTSGKENIRSRKKSRTSKFAWLYLAVMVVFAGAAAFSIYKIAGINSENTSGADFYEILKESMAAPATESTQEAETDPESSETAAPAWAPKTVNFSALKDYNKDVIAWLELPGTIIDYPVAQGYDNDQYLRTLLDGFYHRFGTLFLDWRNSPDFSDDISVIYGHHIKAGDMFCIVENYADQSYYEEHPFFMLYLPDKTCRLEPYAAIYFDSQTVVKRDFDSESSYQAYIDNAVSHSVITTGTAMDSGSKTVALYTCSDRMDDGRFVLLCKISTY